MTTVQFPAGVGKGLSSLHRVQTDSGVYPSSYPMSTGGKATVAWS